LDVVQVEVLQLEALLEEDSTDESFGGDGEAALVEGHERDHESLVRARHGLIPGHLPIHGGSEWRELARLDEMKQLLAGHVGPRLVRHHNGGVSGGLVVQEVVVLWLQKSAERDSSAEEENDGEAKSRTRALRAVKKG
jgi:hypothetical protein